MINDLWVGRCIGVGIAAVCSGLIMSSARRNTRLARLEQAARFRMDRLAAEVQSLKDVQTDLELDLAALILDRKPAEDRVNGNGGSVVRLRQMRPEGSG